MNAAIMPRAHSALSVYVLYTVDTHMRKQSVESMKFIMQRDVRHGTMGWLGNAQR